MRLIEINILNPLSYQLTTKIYDLLAKKGGGGESWKGGEETTKKTTKQNSPIALMELKRSVPLHEHHTALIN